MKVEDSSSDVSTEPCKQCEILKDQIAMLKDKNEKRRIKHRKLKQDYQDLLIQKQILEEKVELLEATSKMALKKSEQTEKTIPCSRVSGILEDFDSIIDSQGREITKLMEDRDRLSSFCFKSLAVAAHQEVLLTKFKTSLEHLSSSLVNGDVDAVSQEFQALGCDISSIASCVRKKTSIEGLNEVLTSMNVESVDEREILRILGELSNTQLSNEALRTVTSFIMQQIAYQRKLIQKNEREKRKRRVISRQMRVLFESLQVETPSDGVKRIHRLKRSLAHFDSLVANIVKVFESFADRFPENADVKRCLDRISNWSPKSNVDIVQEIDFLLGLCIHKESNGVIWKQINALKNAVHQMKTHIRASDRERREFIANELRDSIPLTSKWSDVCHYLLRQNGVT